MQPLLPLLGLLVPYLVECRVELSNNGYTDVVVAISPDIAEDATIIDSIKHMMTEASRELFIATGKRAYFKTVRILLPKTWLNQAGTVPIEDESFETAEFRVDKVNPVYGDSPYTVQNGECGVAGSYTHVTTSFLQGSNWGNRGKTIVYEWAKLRWGVFEEHGYPGDPLFPMFYLTTSWTATGPQNTVMINLCINKEPVGFEQDQITGGGCKRDSNGVPDGNCYFYATQDTAATSSYMALPYLTTVTSFCDDTEQQYHDVSLPSKQNLYCEGRSTWQVISSTPDFANGLNPPNTTITNTEPTFLLVGGGQNSQVAYVLVLDLSLSMNDFNRFVTMTDAAKRWIKFEVQEGVELGIVVFAEETYVMSLVNLTLVTDEAREAMIREIDTLKPIGKTCIGCGLLLAKDHPGQLKDRTGNTIVLITDGKQLCKNPGCTTITDVTPDLVARKIRVITIALGNEADPEIEELALATGGKSYYVEDGSGAGSINDAFTGSTTYQPGDTLGNTTITIYQRVWTAAEIDTAISNNKNLVDLYDIDASVGREVTFQVDLQLTDKQTGQQMDCTQPALIILTSPDDNHSRTNLSFSCDRNNFGVYRYVLPGLAEIGRWVYNVRPGDAYNSLSVQVTGKSRGGSADDADPIRTRCWVSTGGQQLNTGVNVKLAVMAEVMQGNKPVIGANVVAEVERPQEGGQDPQPPLQIQLMDNGAGADSIKNDGIYARYFAQYTGKGRYSVKCQVVGSEGSTQVNEGFITARKRHHVGRFIPEKPGSPICCGSNTVFPDSKLTDTGNFTRQAAGGSFQVTSWLVTNSSDVTPPGRVIDLMVSNPNCSNMELQFTAPGNDLDSEEPAAAYIIKYAATPANLTGFAFQNGTNFNITSDDLLEAGSLDPVAGGQTMQLRLRSERFEPQRLYFFGLRAVDEAGNLSPVSNIAGGLFGCALSTVTTTTTKTTTPNSIITTTSTTTPNSIITTTSTTTSNSIITTTTTTTPNRISTTTSTTTPNSIITTTLTTTPNSIITTTTTTTPNSIITTTLTTTPNSIITTTKTTTPNSIITTTLTTTSNSIITTASTTTSEPSTTPESSAAEKLHKTRLISLLTLISFLKFML